MGGEFSFVVRRGDAELDHVGRYLELDRPRRLAFTWAVAPAADGESRIEVDVRALSPTWSEVTVTHHLLPDWTPHAARIEEGWGRMLGALARALARDGGDAAG